MDFKKRETLKRMTGVVIGGSGLCMIGTSFASNINNAVVSDDGGDVSLSKLKIHTRMSSSKNNIEIVITNTGDNVARITQITPSRTITHRGVFNFMELMKEGDLVLEAGHSVSVQMTPHTMISGLPSNNISSTSSLTDSLRSSFSVITDNEAFACVDVVGNIWQSLNVA